jgi:alginate O-acetyltransferase complex protein AlgI
MVFSSPTFLFYFLPVFLLLYYLLPWKNGVLLVASLLFYAWGEPRFVPLLVLSAFVNYIFGYAIAKSPARRRPLLWTGIGLNLAFLGFYKYLGFFGDMLNSVLRLTGNAITLPEVVLPLGISFFTFQGISYLIDVSRGDVNAQKSFWTFAMYKAMFPQLIAGPIVRYRQIADEVEHRDIPDARFLAGLEQFAIGLAQKVLIANTVAITADKVFDANLAQIDTPGAWIGLACYSIQILFDFAGYSNMAIGIGHMIGFSYPPNFNRPYTALSVTEFWRRWHISLSSWFRDYVYIPLGGNRISPARTYIHLGTIFLLCGLWHGAAWTFVIWGAWHGALLIIERLGLGSLLERLPSILAQSFTLLMVMLGWVFFRAKDVPHALGFFQTLAGTAIGIDALPLGILLAPAGMAALVIGTLIAVVRPPLSLTDRFSAFTTHRATALKSVTGRGALIFMLILLCSASLAAGTYNPFIYFRF